MTFIFKRTEPRVPETVENPRGLMKVSGEPFSIEFEEGDVHLTHPQWSLAGVGSTLAEAELDLIDEAKGLAAAMLEFPDETLDPIALSLKAFVLPFLTVTT